MRLHRFNTQTGEHEIQDVDGHALRLARMRRRVRAWAIAAWELYHTQNVRFIGVGLTYRPGAAWLPEHISATLRRLVRLMGGDLLAYAWVAELQQRGAVHYHLCLAVRVGAWVPMFDKVYRKRGQRLPLWPHGSSHMNFDIVPSDKYFMKYGEKSEQKRDQFPKGLRIHATVIRPGARLALPARTFFFWKLSAAVQCVRHWVMTFLNQVKAYVHTPEWFIGWKWHALPGGDWAIYYRKKHPLTVVHTEWWCEDYPRGNTRKSPAKVKRLSVGPTRKDAQPGAARPLTLPLPIA